MFSLKPTSRDEPAAKKPLHHVKLIWYRTHFEHMNRTRLSPTGFGPDVLTGSALRNDESPATGETFAPGPTAPQGIDQAPAINQQCTLSQTC